MVRRYRKVVDERLDDVMDAFIEDGEDADTALSSSRMGRPVVICISTLSGSLSIFSGGRR